MACDACLMVVVIYYFIARFSRGLGFDYFAFSDRTSN
jgi:hypothetical protein